MKIKDIQGYSTSAPGKLDPEQKDTCTLQQAIMCNFILDTVGGLEITLNRSDFILYLSDKHSGNLAEAEEIFNHIAANLPAILRVKK